jgi:hypothetical protein
MRFFELLAFDHCIDLAVTLWGCLINDVNCSSNVASSATQPTLAPTNSGNPDSTIATIPRTKSYTTDVQPRIPLLANSNWRDVDQID